MIASMTGFARRELNGTFGTLTCELRSVNHRYLEPGFRLPEELRPLESELRQQLSKNLKRGKVDCTVHLRSAQAAERELKIDAAALARVAAAVGEISRAVPGTAWLSVIRQSTFPRRICAASRSRSVPSSARSSSGSRTSMSR